MSNAGNFVRAAQPKLHIEFIPPPSYWIVFSHYEEGEILDVEQLSDAVKLVFEPKILQRYRYTATKQYLGCFLIQQSEGN
ncbi:hypothetical protein [Pectobacterium aroidearum]|uniref:hypothetical protein n=1 Tax=Pectobacterium aroidearum TaxID=1201031 RepID=UPI0026359821|nr:hypothetical protein [Pectobacterium aroidearum]WKA62435.1 hypothetical protein QX495_21290 [Pectobacterium aroidearum]